MNRIAYIKSSDKRFAEAARERWNSIAKPLGSLGLLENAVEKIAAVQGTEDINIDSRAVVVMCADNGVVEEGISQSGSDVTTKCVSEICAGKSNINVLARAFHADVTAVNAGLKNPPKNAKNLFKINKLHGTKNFFREPAMTRSVAEELISAGMDIARDLHTVKYKILICGEMGIGNTATAAAVTSALLNVPPQLVTGRGAGLDNDRLVHKMEVIYKALKLHNPDPNDPVDILAKVGGFDIAAMTGLFLGGAFYGIPVIIDGVVSAAAACLAYHLNPKVRDYMLASHVSSEPAGKLLLENIGLQAPITAQLHLGEGTGGAFLLPLLDGALEVYYKAHRFTDAKIERYKEFK